MKISEIYKKSLKTSENQLETTQGWPEAKIQRPGRPGAESRARTPFGAQGWPERPRNFRGTSCGSKTYRLETYRPRPRKRSRNFRGTFVQLAADASQSAGVAQRPPQRALERFGGVPRAPSIPGRYYERFGAPCPSSSCGWPISQVDGAAYGGRAFSASTAQAPASQAHMISDFAAALDLG